MMCYPGQQKELRRASEEKVRALHRQAHQDRAIPPGRGRAGLAAAEDQQVGERVGAGRPAPDWRDIAAGSARTPTYSTSPTSLNAGAARM
jgi:hypothetical protein